MMLVGQKNVVTCCNQELNVYEKKTHYLWQQNWMLQLIIKFSMS
jgi:hypothetical protein